MSHATCGDRRPVSQLHSADDVPELMRRALRSFVRAEELAKDLARVSDSERDALRSGFLDLVKRFAVQLREEGEIQARATVRMREELDDALMPFSVRHHCTTLLSEADARVAEVFTLTLAHSGGVSR